MNKSRTIFCVALLCGALTSAERTVAAEEGCLAAEIDSIVQAIKLPEIPAREFNIVDFRATEGGTEDARPSILAAIREAVAHGGGRVVVPAGNWLSNGPIVLQSKIELHLEEGARLQFSARAEHYLPAVLTRWEGTELYGYSPLIYARDVHDVAITGTGTIDGNPNSEFLAWTELQAADQLALRKMGAGGVPVEDRDFGAGHYLRPSLIQLFSAERVLLSGFTAENSPFWVNHLVYTNHATVRGIRVDSHYANNDGVDVDSSRYVLVEDSHFRTGDDSVVVKSGRDRDGRDIARPSEYVVVRNNDMGGEDGIALGSEMSGDVREVYFVDNVMRSGTAAFRFKSNLDRGGVVEKIRVCRQRVESFDRLFWFQLDYPGELGGNFPALYHDIVFEDITVEKAETVLEVHAPKGAPLRDVTFRNVNIGHGSRDFILENAENLVFDNVIINGERVDVPWSQRAVDSMIARSPEAWRMRPHKGLTEPQWAYTYGLALLATQRVYEQTRNPAHYDYVRTWVDSLIDEDGHIRNIEITDFNIDSVNAGKLLFALYEKTGDKRYRKAMDSLRTQLEWQPRTRSGGFWHKRIYPWQMWLDGLYMGSAYWAQYAATFGEDSESFDDITHQFALIESKTRDPETGLLFHGWDESRLLAWADEETGLSPNFWSRAMGWYAMALVDSWEHFPTNHAGRDTLAAILQRLIDALLPFQHESGIWYQVTDQGGREGNYLEASGTGMFVYAIAKGVRLGILDKQYLAVAEKGFDGLVTELVRIDANGQVSLTNICGSAGLGGIPFRDGSFEYYIGEPRVDNDPHGVGPFILAALELDR